MTVIGTNTSADIQLPARDSSIGQAHAVIVNLNGRHLLQDLLSLDSTKVNGIPIKLRYLDFGDVISVTGCELKYTSHQPQAASADDTSSGISNRFVEAAQERSHETAIEKLSRLPIDAVAEASDESLLDLRPARRWRTRRAVAPSLNIAPTTARRDSSDQSSTEVSSTPTESELPPDIASARRRSKIRAIGLMMAAVMIAGGGIWSSIEPTSILEGTIAFDPATPTSQPTIHLAFEQAQESLLASSDVRRSAMQWLEHTQPGTDPTFLTSARGLAPDGKLFWEEDKETGRLTMVLHQPSSAPNTDKLRLAALLHAIYETNSRRPSTSTGIESMREELLRAEVEELAGEVSYERRRGSELQEELRQADSAEISDEQFRQQQSEVAKLRIAYRSALAARIRAEFGREEQFPSPQRPPEPTTKPKISEKAGTPNEADARRQAEELASTILGSAERRLMAMNAQRATVASRKAQLAIIMSQHDVAAESLKSKVSLLTSLQDKSASRPRATPPNQVRVISTNDPRGNWIALATMLIAIGFFIIFLTPPTATTQADHNEPTDGEPLYIRKR